MLLNEMLFYMRGIGKVQEGRDPSRSEPACCSWRLSVQLHPLDGLREDEVAASSSSQAEKTTSSTWKQLL